MTEIEKSPVNIIIVIIELGKEHQWTTIPSQRWPILADHSGTCHLALYINKIVSVTYYSSLKLASRINYYFYL